MKKMLAILASPRKNGNVAKMLDIAVNKAEQIGYEVAFVDLYEKKIAWCKGCMSCRKDGACVINDDTKELAEQLRLSDLVAVASPTYFANVPAPLKNMFDRLVYVVMDDNDGPIPKSKLSPKQKYLILVTCTTPWPFNTLAGQSTGAVRAIKEFFHVSGMKQKGVVVFPGTRNKNETPSAIARKITSIVS